MKTKKVFIKYGQEVIPEEEERFDSVYIVTRGHELLVIETALHSLKMTLKEGERGEVLLDSDLSENCFKALMLRKKEDKSFVPEGITLIVSLFSGPSMPES